MKTRTIFAVFCAAFISFGSLYAGGQKGKAEQTELLWYHGGGDMSAFPDIPRSIWQAKTRILTK